MQENNTNKPSDGMNPVLSFNCDGDIRTKKDSSSHLQIPPSINDQQLQMYAGVNSSAKSQSSNSSSSSSYVHGMPSYSQMEPHGHQVLNTKNHSHGPSGNSHNYQSPFHQSHDSVMPSPSHPGSSSSSKQSVNAPQYPSSRHHGVHINSVHTVSSPNHMGLNSDYSGGESGHSSHSLAHNPLGTVNDSSAKVNFGAANQNEVPLVKQESIKKNAAISNELGSQKPIKVITVTFAIHSI